MELDVEVTAMRVFEQALDVPAGEREAWLDALELAPAIRRRVEDLLAAEQPSARFLETRVLPPGAATPVTLPVAGERIGAWRIERPLDAGGMGVVFLARRDDGSYEQQVAIKFVRIADAFLSADRRSDLLARFANERRVLARLEHPNIVRILDGGSTDAGVPYLVMEYVDGVALNNWCDRHHLDIAARVELVARVCDGVQAAHRHLIVHRDLKPQNILVGSDGEPRVLDFGIARTLAGGDADDVEVTRTAMQAMTPAYASPEQMRHEPLTTASDVYSLGVVLYELLAGRRPHALDGSSPAQSERIVSDRVPPTLRRALGTTDLPEPERRARIAGIGDDLERIVALALHKDPERRYGSAQALAEDLRRHLDGRPVHAHPDSIGYRFGKFVQRHRVGVVAAACALAAVLAATATAFWQAAAARRAAADMREVNGFLVDVLEVSNPYHSGSELTLADALDEAAVKVEERFGTRPDLAVDIRFALGQSMLSRYRLEAGEAQLARALADSESAFGRNDERSIRSLGALASLRKEQDRFIEAAELFADALARIDAGGLVRSELHSSLLNDFGVMRLIEEDFAGARVLLEKSLAVGDAAQPPPTPAQRAQTLGNLAQAARGLGELDRADALYGEVQAIFERIYPDGSPYLAIVLNNRARVARARKQPEQSLALLEKAVAMHRRSFDGDHVMILVPMTNLARQAHDLGRLELAAEWGERAAAMGERLYAGRSHVYLAQARLALAGIRASQQRNADAAGLLLRARASLDALESPSESTEAYYATLRAQVCADPAQVGAPPCTP